MRRTLVVASAMTALAGTDGRHRALVMADDKIVWAGANPADSPAVDRTIDVGVGWLTPGFVDAHVHATATGMQAVGIDLSGAGSVAEVLTLVRERAADRPDGLVYGAGWDDRLWPEGRPPTAVELAEAAPGCTVVLLRVDSHSCVVDARLLAALDLTGHAEHVVVGADGAPTGWLLEGASGQALAAMQDSITEHDRDRARRAACERALALGITSIHEMGIPVLSDRADALTWATGDWPIEVHAYWAEMAVDPTGVLRPGGDLFLDGSIGSCTAATHAPYVDNQGGTSTGELFHDDEAVAAFFIAATRAGIGAGVHAIGDRAINQALRAIRTTAHICGPMAVRAARHRLEHVEMIGRDDIATMADLGVVASVQPAFDAAWNGSGGLYEQRFGRIVADCTNPLSWLDDEGVRMCFSSDSTVTPMDPWGGIDAAENHFGGLSVDRSTGLTAATIGGHHAVGTDEDVGRLAPGQRADIVVWPEDPLTLDASAPPDPTLVIAGGHVRVGG